MRKTSLEEKLITKIRVNSKTLCWEWVATLNWGGYGKMGNQGAHRVVYEFLIGKIPEGLQLDHLCRNRACVNPMHLEPVTARINRNRGRFYNAEKTHCKWGHEFNKENTYINPKNQRRTCIHCKRKLLKEWRNRKKESCSLPL